MSYYTYFYPKKDLFGDFTDSQIDEKLKKLNQSKEEIKVSILTTMIDLYYKQSLDYRDIKNLKFNCDLLRNYHKEIEKLRLQHEINYAYSDKDNKDNSIEINYADAQSKYSLEQDIKDEDNYYNDVFESLVVLSRIKFKPKNKEDRYAEDPIDEMSYLRYTYIDSIKALFDLIESTAEDNVKNQFMIECFDTKKEEKEFYDEDEESSSDNSDAKEPEGNKEN